MQKMQWQLWFVGVLALVSGGRLISSASRAYAQDDTRPAAILDFYTVDPMPPTLTQYETAGFTATLAWQTINFKECCLVLEVSQDNKWVEVQTAEPLFPNGSIEVRLPSLSNLNGWVYRLSLYAAEGGLLYDQRYLQIGLKAEEGQTPYIEDFNLVWRQSTADTAEDFTVQVSWRVKSRQPMTNLEFVQVFPDGSVQNVELPRCTLWVNSQGVGQLHPSYPANGNQVILRLQVVDLLSGMVLAQQEMSIQAPEHPTATPIPTGVPQRPTAGATPTDAPQIQLQDESPTALANSSIAPQLVQFNLNPNPVDFTQPITMFWEVSHAQSVSIISLRADTQSFSWGADPALSWQNQPATGQLNFNIPPGWGAFSVKFRINVLGEDGQHYVFDTEDFAAICYDKGADVPNPTIQCYSNYPTQTSAATFQQYEFGLVIQRLDDQTSYVLYHPRAEIMGWQRFNGAVSAETLGHLGAPLSEAQSYTLHIQFSVDPTSGNYFRTYDMDTPDGQRLRLISYSSSTLDIGPTWSYIPIS